jgi:hypothetical protein
VLDRLISGAGAWTDRADRVVRTLTSGRGPDVLGHRPGSIVIIILLIVVAIIFGLVAIEATDNPTPRELAPAEVATADDIGRRVYATIEGVIAESYVETYPDDDGDGVQDTDETGDAWFYFLVDDAGMGVTVRSTRTPDDIYRYTGTGVVVHDPDYVAVDVRQFGQLTGASGITLDPAYYIDAVTAPPDGSPQPLDLSTEMPAAGTLVTITGPYVGYLDVCSGDADGDGTCEEAEFDLIDAFIADPDTGRAITVVQEDHPSQELSSFTGMLRDESSSIAEAKSTRDLDFDALGITVSDQYLLDDQATPANGILSMAAAIGAALVAAILAIGLAGGYLVFRRSKRPLPSGARTLGPGDEIPVRVTGSVRREGGLLHLREAKARLVRFPLEAPAPAVPAPAEPPAEAPVEAEPAAPVVWASTSERSPADAAVTPAETDVAPEPPPVEPEPAPPDPTGWVPSWSSVIPQVEPAAEQPADRRSDVPTTLIVERVGKPEGVALGRGELKQVMSGRVMPFRGPRPALRVEAGTGILYLSFDSKEDRDRAAAELIAEAGLLIRDTGIAASPG